MPKKRRRHTLTQNMTALYQNKVRIRRESQKPRSSTLYDGYVLQVAPTQNLPALWMVENKKGIILEGTLQEIRRTHRQLTKTKGSVYYLNRYLEIRGVALSEVLEWARTLEAEYICRNFRGDTFDAHTITPIQAAYTDLALEGITSMRVVGRTDDGGTILKYGTKQIPLIVGNCEL